MRIAGMMTSNLIMGVWSLLLIASTTTAFQLPAPSLVARIMVENMRVGGAGGHGASRHGAISTTPWGWRSTSSTRKRGIEPSMMVLKPMPSSESLMIPPPEKVLKAVEKAGGRVTVQDVAAIGGVDLVTAQQGLVKLATLVQGDLEVTKDGDLVYQFPRNFRTALRTRSVTQRAKELWVKIWPSLFYATRVSFGLCLILSIILVFATITFAGSSQMNSRDDDDRRRGRGGEYGGMYRGPSMYFWGPSPFDFFFPRPYGYYYTRNSRAVQQSGQTVKDPEEMGFLESCFSYIFGDGNPNLDLEETRYQMIAQVIRQNGGAVVAEQLAPYLDIAAPQDPTSYSMAGSGPLTTVVDESYVLPVLTRLSGRPEVTPDGNIVYVFPDLMTSAVERGGVVDARWSQQQEVDSEVLKYQGMTAHKLRELLKSRRIPTEDCYDKSDLLERLRAYLLAAPSTAKVRGDATYLEEDTIPFSLAPAQNRIFAAILGFINLGGAVVLGNVLRDYTIAYGPNLPGLLSLSQALYVPLMVYAIGFNVIPLVRSLWLKEKNTEIERRNESRRTWATILGRAIGPLYEKILAARNYRSKMKVVKKQDALYTTTKSAAEQTKEKEAQDMLDFDPTDQQQNKNK